MSSARITGKELFLKDALSPLGTKFLPSNSFDNLSITDCCYDSKQLKPGAAFFCIPGEKTDGNIYASAAAKSGAACLVSEKSHPDLTLPQAIVPDIRLALAVAADAFYQHPSTKIRLIGVTGTNGKTTTTHLIEHILTSAGKKTGLIGTLGSRKPGDNIYSNAKHTTPQAPELQAMLKDMLDSGCSHIAMEVSSHSLALKRVAYCQFAVACLTNVTQDHLDFHTTMENYWHSKRLLFEELNKSTHKQRTAIVNLDDPLALQFLSVCGKDINKLTYGFSSKADVHVLKTELSDGFNNLSLATPYGKLSFKTKLIGKFNVYNCLAACSICLAEGVEPEKICQAISTFSGVPGRFEVVTLKPGNEPLCIVDYAHTPDGLENVLKAAAELKKNGNKLIVVFGCGGDRDHSKRPQMGKIAENIADKVIVTSDNPRSEEPQEIIAQILRGISRIHNVTVEQDRSNAINLAISEANKNDIVVVAGKGHENYQLIKDKVLPFDDKLIVTEALNNYF